MPNANRLVFVLLKYINTIHEMLVKSAHLSEAQRPTHSFCTYNHALFVNLKIKVRTTSLGTKTDTLYFCNYYHALFVHNFNTACDAFLLLTKKISPLLAQRPTHCRREPVWSRSQWWSARPQWTSSSSCRTPAGLVRVLPSNSAGIGTPRVAPLNRPRAPSASRVGRAAPWPVTFVTEKLNFSV